MFLHSYKHILIHEQPTGYFQSKKKKQSIISVRTIYNMNKYVQYFCALVHINGETSLFPKILRCTDVRRELNSINKKVTSGKGFVAF